MWGHIILIKGNIIYVTYSNKLLCHIYIINLYKLCNNNYNKLYLLQILNYVIYYTVLSYEHNLLYVYGYDYNITINYRMWILHILLHICT